MALTNALKHLHQHGLVHRDVKPSNIIFVNGIPKLADIGLVTESEATVTYVGAHGFMAPDGPGRPQADLYSLGKVIYEMCTGRDRMDFPALPGDFGLWPHRESVLELLAVSMKACEPAASKRYETADTIVADLLLLMAGKSVRRLRLLEKGRRWALAMAVVGIVIACAAWKLSWDAQTRERVRHREVLIRKAEMSRMGERYSGWSSNALALLQQAGKVQVDDDLRTQAAATLSAMDTHWKDLLPNTTAYHLTFDARQGSIRSSSQPGSR